MALLCALLLDVGFVSAEKRGIPEDGCHTLNLMIVDEHASSMPLRKIARFPKLNRRELDLVVNGKVVEDHKSWLKTIILACIDEEVDLG